MNTLKLKSLSTLLGYIMIITGIIAASYIGVYLPITSTYNINYTIAWNTLIIIGREIAAIVVATIFWLVGVYFISLRKK